MKHEDYLAWKIKTDPQFRELWKRGNKLEKFLEKLAGRELTEKEWDIAWTFLSPNQEGK